MGDIAGHVDGWRFGTHSDPSDDHSTALVISDTGAENESNEGYQSNSFAVPHIPGPPTTVSVTVGHPTRFGNPNEELQGLETRGLEPECNISADVQDILKKVSVNEGALRAAVESLGNDTAGMTAVLEYVKLFQERRDPPEDFAQGLQQFCLRYGQAREDNQNKWPFEELERRVACPDVQAPGQEDWARNLSAAGDSYAMGPYGMSGFYPSFYCPYPPQFAGYAPFNMGMHPMYMSMMGVPCFNPPVQEYGHSTDAATRASRKSRIARRRGHIGGLLQPHSASLKPARVAAGHKGMLENSSIAVAPPRQGVHGLNTNNLVILLEKQLSPSGVNSLGRIVLPKKEAEAHLPHLLASERVLLTMTDFDTRQSWTFRYRFWSNNKSRMYLLENTRDFVKTHNLQERDILVLYKDGEGNYVVRGEKNDANRPCNATGGVATDLSNKKQKGLDSQHGQGIAL